MQSLSQSQAQLISDRATLGEKLQDLQLAKLRQALDLRKQLNTDELNPTERRNIIIQLTSLGIKGRTDELSILKQIENKEKAIADAKLKNLKIQQDLKQKEFTLEVGQLELATRKANLEAKKEQRSAQKELISAEKAIALAETPEELKTANELYELAVLSLKLANDEAIAAQKEQDNLKDTIAKKKEILDLNQDIERAELTGNTLDQEAENRKQRADATERRDGRQGKNIDKYLSTQERIDKQVASRKEKVESKGGEFSEDDEAEYRKKLQATSYKLQANQENAVLRSLLGNTGFTIEASPEVLNAIAQNKSFLVPNVPSTRSDAPLEIQTFGKTKGSLNEDNLILKTLQNIETKFKQPTVIQVKNDNNFTNVYDKSSTDDVPRIVRSELVDMINTLDSNLH